MLKRYNNMFKGVNEPMPFGAHETVETHEILNEKMNLINHFSIYEQECQNPQLKSMISRHLQTAIQAYDQMVAYTHNYSAASHQPATPTRMMNIQPNQIQYGLDNPMRQQPMMAGRGRLNDQQIAMAVLSFHKNSAVNHMRASLECADPNCRQMMIQGAVTCSNLAYEIFVFMNQHGLYQVPTLKDHTAKTFMHAYQPSTGNARPQQTNQQMYQ